MFKQKQCLMSILTSAALSLGYIFLLDFIILRTYDLFVETSQVAYSLVLFSIALLLSSIFEGVAFVTGVRYVLKDVDA